MNWSGDNIRNLETITFTRNDDKTITVDHRVQQGSKEVEGSLSGTGAIDGEVVQRTLIEGALLRRVAGLLDDLCANAWLAIYDSDDLRNVNLVTAHPERIRANPPAT